MTDTTQLTRFARGASRHLAAALSVLVLAACSGGGGGNDPGPAVVNDPPPPPPPSPTASFNVSSSSAFEKLDVFITNADAGATYTITADLGDGFVIDYPFTRHTDSHLTLIAPPGVMHAQQLFESGVVRFTLVHEAPGGNDQVLDPIQLVVHDLPVSTVPDGAASEALLLATEALALNFTADLGIVAAHASSSVTIGQPVQAANLFVEAARNLRTTIGDAAASGGSGVTGTGPLALPDASTVPILERLSIALLDRIADTSATPQLAKLVAVASGKASAADVNSFFDIEGLTSELADAARDNAELIHQVVKVTSGIVAVGALAAGSPSIALAAGTVAAVSWFTTTAWATAVGGILDAAPNAILEGKADFEDFSETIDFALDRYTDLAVDWAANNALSQVFGELGSQLIQTGNDAVQLYEEFAEDQMDPAFDTGAFPEDGVPESSFSLAVSAQASPYLITVDTVPAMDGATIRVQVSGTDGYLFNQDVTTFNGTATAQPQPGSAGVVDSISVFDVNGRASASTQVTF